MACDVPKDLRDISKKVNYSPQNDKFEGYGQFPRPQVAPYQNKLDVKNLQKYYRTRQKEDLTDMQNEHMILSDKNKDLASKTLDARGILKPAIFGVDFLSGRLNSFNGAPQETRNVTHLKSQTALGAIRTRPFSAQRLSGSNSSRGSLSRSESVGKQMAIEDLKRFASRGHNQLNMLPITKPPIDSGTQQAE